MPGEIEPMDLYEHFSKDTAAGKGGMYGAI